VRRDVHELAAVVVRRDVHPGREEVQVPDVLDPVVDPCERVRGLEGWFNPVAVGLTFTNTSGLFSMPASGTAQFYKISSP